jgi:hypothetical protein
MPLKKSGKSGNRKDMVASTAPFLGLRGQAWSGTVPGQRGNGLTRRFNLANRGAFLHRRL